MRLIPREEKFFDMFEKAAQNVVKGTHALHDMLVHYEQTQEKSKVILEIEHEGDILTHEIIDALNKTFITPIDREDIHALASSLDDILDYAEGVADRFDLYRMGKPSEEALKLSQIIVDSAEQIDKAIKGLRDLKHPRRVLDRCIEINRLENDGDKLFRQALAKLFARENNAMEAIKWKEIYENLELAIDRCEDVANVIESVIVKYA